MKVKSKYKNPDKYIVGLKNELARTRNGSHICISAPEERMAINKKTGHVTYFDLFEIMGPGEVIDTSIKGRYCILADCHLCGFTGCTDSEGEEVYGGHILTMNAHPFADGAIILISWSVEKSMWIYEMMTTNKGSVDSLVTMTSHGRGLKNFTIIAHFHIPKAWPEEVVTLLKGDN